MNETSSATFETSKSTLEDLLSINIVGIEKFIEHDGYAESIPTELPCHYRFSIVLRDYATNHPVSFLYYPENMDESLKELRTLTLIRQKSQKLPVLSCLQTICDTASSTDFDGIYHISNHTGWIRDNHSWIYLTSGYGIDKAGERGDCRSLASNGYLFYDKMRTPKDTYMQILEILNQAPGELYPIFCCALLSLMQPLKGTALPYSTPGCMISGKTQTGKTELAIHVGRIMTDHTGNLRNTFILQDSLKKYKQDYSGLCDCTNILDDNRKSGSYDIQNKSTTVMDDILRSFYLDNLGVALPIITGEANSFYRMSESWNNRLIQVFFNFDAESLDNRRSIIRSLKTENPLLFRTGYRYFIQYLAANMDNGALHALTREVVDEFTNSFPVGDNASYRQRDNFMLSYWALKVYLTYGVSIPAITEEKAETLLLQYIEILKNSFEKQMTFNPLQYTCGTLLSVLKNMKITSASAGERIYPDYKNDDPYDYSYSRRRYDTFELENYGHTVFIDNRIESNGVFIEDCYQVENYRNASRKRVLLVLKRDAFMTAYETALSCTSSFVPHTQLVPFKDFRKALKENKVLLGEPRNDTEKNYLNYSLEYPCINLDRFSKDIYLEDESVYVLNLPKDLIKPVLDLTSRESDSSSSCSKECGRHTDWLTKMRDTGRRLAYLE